MKIQAFPSVEISPDTYEIGEFDCASIFLLVGDERAMLIDPTPNPKFPCFTALIQAAMLLFLAGVVLSRAGVALSRRSRASTWLIWIVVGFSAISLLVNLVTPSSGERMLWAPVALILLVTSLIVAIRGRSKVPG